MNNTFDLDKAIRRVPNFPHEGILFYDITSIFTNPEAFQYCLDKMSVLYSKSNIDAVAAIEARGFLFAAPFAAKLGLPLILIRKKGKLPGETISKDFSLEYGTSTIEIHKADIVKGARTLIVDDLAATGGTLRASADLLVEAGAVVEDIFCVIGLSFLPYKEVLEGFNVSTLINYSNEMV